MDSQPSAALSTPAGVSKSHQRVADIVSALDEVIRSQQEQGHTHQPTPTEYFVVIFRSLGVSSELTEHVVDLLTILNGVVPNVSKAILRDQFKGVTLLLSKIIQKSDSSKLLRLCLDIMGGLLQAQDHSEGFWGSVHTLKVVNMFLGLLDDDRVKIRKTVQSTLLAVLKEHKKTNSTTLSSYVSEFCFEILKSCTRSDYKRSLAIVQFLENALPLLPSDAILQLFDVSLRLPGCNQPVLSASMLKMIDSFYQSPFLTLRAAQLFECVRFLIAMPPDTLDMEANAYYCTAIASGLLRVKEFHDNTAVGELLVSGSVCLGRACETDFTQIHCAIATALKRLIQGYITEAWVQSSVNSSSSSSSSSSLSSHGTLYRFLSSIEVLLQLRYQRSWIYILDAVRSLFEVIRGKQAVALLASYVTKLADVNQAIETGLLSVETPILLAVSDTLSAMLKSVGVSNFLSLVPFGNVIVNPQTQQTTVDSSREWLLTVMHSSLKTYPCSLAEFGSAILPLASQCDAMLKAPEKHRLSEVETKRLRNRVLQLWSLLPDFVSFGCVDIVAIFPKSADILEKSMKNPLYPEILMTIVTALAHIARNAIDRASGGNSGQLADTAEICCLRSYAAKFIPAILDFLETIDITDVRFQPCANCVSLWVAIAPLPLVTAVTRKLLQLLLISTQLLSEQAQNSSSSSMATDGEAAVGSTGGSNEENVAAGWMSVLRSIIPYLSSDLVCLLYKTVRPLLSVDESLSVQKRAYHVLDGLLQHSAAASTIYQSVEPSMAILSVISESLLTCHVSARNMRLRCIETLLTTSLSEEEVTAAATNLLGEILICQRDSNQKSRLAAMTVLKTFITRVPVPHMMLLLCSAIVGETTVMRSSGITGLCVLLMEKRSDPQIGSQLLAQSRDLLPTICILLREECAEQTRAILSFVRICCSSLPVQMLQEQQDDSAMQVVAASHVIRSIVQAICIDIGTLKTKFASRVRAIFRKLIQRLGPEVFTNGLVPEADMSLIQYILRQNRRNYRKRHQKEKSQKDEISKMLGSDSESGDSDSDSEDIDKQKVSITRPKAIRSQEIMTSSVPTTLDNLLEDQPASFMVSMSGNSQLGQRKKFKAKRAVGTGGAVDAVNGEPTQVDDEDEDYRVVVGTDGKICVTSKATGPASGSKQLLALAESLKQSMDRKDNDDDDDNNANKFQNKKFQKQSQAANKRARKDPGEEYRAKKAGGDVWKQGMLAPHAYIPLDPKLLSKKNRSSALQTLGAVVGGSNSSGMLTNVKGKSKSRGFVVGNRKQRQSGRDHK